MKLARLLYPVRTLGPGNRVGIWICGCERHCPGCANPELWQRERYGEIKITDIVKTIAQLERQGYPKPDGITITGGEPCESQELPLLLTELQPITRDILLYTGYLREELSDREESVIGKLAVLIDGPYRQEENQGHPLRGSENQRIHYIRPEYRERYEDYIRNMQGARAVQNFKLADGKACVGIHEREFRKEYEDRRNRRQ